VSVGAGFLGETASQALAYARGATMKRSRACCTQPESLAKERIKKKTVHGGQKVAISLFQMTDSH
jgi:hypothetical protein